jgi:ATP-binding cassette subfamily B protein/subfamily B ATP-binding cassette protein MsbA
MRLRRTSSRTKYVEYLAKRRSAGRPTESILDEVEAANAKRKRARSFRALFVAFWELLRGYRWTLIAALGTLTFATGVSLIVPGSTKFTIDYVLSDKPGPEGIPAWLGLPRDRHTLLWLSCGLVMGLSIAAIAVSMWGRFQVTRLTKRVQARLRRRTFEHAVRLPLHRIQQHKTGGLVSILREDAGQAGELIFTMIYNPWRAIVQLGGTLVVLALVDWRMLVGAVLLVPAVAVSHRTWIRRIRPVYRDIKATRTSIDAHTTESFGGIRVVRGFGRGQAEATRFVVANHFMARKEILVWLWSRVVDVAWSILIPMASCGLMLYAGYAILNHQLTLGDLIMFTTYLLMLLGPLETLTSTATNIQTNLAGFDRVLDLLDEPREFETKDAEPKRAVAKGEVRGEIELRGVSFAYPATTKRDKLGAPVPQSGAAAVGEGVADHAGPTAARGAAIDAGDIPDAAANGSLNGAAAKPGPRFVVRDISLTIHAGETVALVGASGSGKTTLCNLVARFYDPTLGAVLLDGIDLREIDIDSYRRLLGIVEQDVFLFDGTVAENIAYAKRDATMERIVDAARTAYADEFIRALELGYETVIGERGVRLSGGQRQRLAIARAVLADPVILILDEATSNLDAESESYIRSSLQVLMRERTSLVIAHRLSTIRNADRIVVLEGGRIVEIGKHHELLAAGGRYADLLRTQIESHGEVEAPGRGTNIPAVGSAGGPRSPD